MASFVAKPEILGSIPLDRHAVIEASAGTGKTYTLEHLVIDLLLTAEVDLGELLVVTFTEKAAAELRSRLRQKMTSLLETTEGTSSAPGDGIWTIDDAARKKLSRALLSFDSASISTIHAFCQRVLAENAFESGRHFEQELVDGRATFERAFYHVLRTTIAHHDEERIFLDAWLSGDSLERLVGLLWAVHEKRGAFDPPYDEAGLVATLRALAKMELTPHALRPAMMRAKLHPNTTKAILERLASLRRALTDFERDADLPALLATLEQENRRRDGAFLSYAIVRLEEHVTEEGKLKELLVALEALSQRLVGFQSAVCQRFLPLVRAEVEKQKAKRGELDFDDMLTLLAQSLDGDTGPTMIEALRKRFRYALIDEFQDTDEVQWRVFSKVFLESDGRSFLYVIGDPKQAIYGFRGADVHTYLRARERIVAAGGALVHLTESFRASARMVEALNHILDEGAEPSFFTGAIRYDHPVTCGATELVGVERDGHVLAPVHVWELVPKDEQFGRTLHARRTLADRIAEETVTLLDVTRTRYVTGDRSTPLAASDVFVLTRSASEGLEVARSLRERGVPHAFYKQDGLFQTREAKDVRNLLAAIADPLDQSRRLYAWQSPFFAVPIEELPRLRDLTSGHRLMKLLLDWKTLADDKRFERLFFSVLEETGLIERELFLHESERELTNYLHIFEVLVEETHDSRATLPELLYTLGHFIEGRRSPPGEDGNVQRIESERDAVQIMTMHKAKGLEAAVVFLFGGFDEPFGRVFVHHDEGRRLLHVGPARPEAVQTEAAEEDQRLLYVAMTRAKARLYLPYFGTKADDEGADLPVLKKLVGTHRQLNDRLSSVLEGPVDPGLFGHEALAERERRRDDEDRPDPLPAIATWKPDEAVFAPVVPRPDLDRLRAAHRGFDVTSYSRIKAQKGGYKAPAGLLEEEIAFDVDGAAPADPDVLPSGPATGRFLHEMLELVPAEAILDAGSVELFGARRDVRELFLDGLTRYDLDPRHLLEAQTLVYTSMVGPLALGEKLVKGVVSADRLVREMEFLFPYARRDPRTASGGFVKGFIDLVVEHDGLVYVLDWKSDLLPDYDAATIRAHVAENYQLQAQLYSLALVKLFALDDEQRYEVRFGGAIYCFIRGMSVQGDGTRGVYFSRPSFDTLRRYEPELEALASQGSAP